MMSTRRSPHLQRGEGARDDREAVGDTRSRRVWQRMAAFSLPCRQRTGQRRALTWSRHPACPLSPRSSASGRSLRTTSSPAGPSARAALPAAPARPPGCPAASGNRRSATSRATTLLGRIPDDVAGHGAVAHGVGPAALRANHAPDRGAWPGVGRKEEPVRPQELVELIPADPGLHNAVCVVHVEPKDRPHPRQVDADAPQRRGHMPLERGATARHAHACVVRAEDRMEKVGMGGGRPAVRNHGHAGVVAHGDHPLDLLRRQRPDHHLRAATAESATEPALPSVGRHTAARGACGVVRRIAAVVRQVPPYSCSTASSTLTRLSSPPSASTSRGTNRLAGRGAHAARRDRTMARSRRASPCPLLRARRAAGRTATRRGCTSATSAPHGRRRVRASWPPHPAGCGRSTWQHGRPGAPGAPQHGGQRRSSSSSRRRRARRTACRHVPGRMTSCIHPTTTTMTRQPARRTPTRDEPAEA